MSSEADSPDPRVARLEAEVLRPLFEADGGILHGVRREAEGYVLVVGGSMAGCPALELTLRHVVAPAFERVLGRPVDVRFELRPGTPPS